MDDREESIKRAEAAIVTLNNIKDIIKADKEGPTGLLGFMISTLCAQLLAGSRTSLSRQRTSPTGKDLTRILIKELEDFTTVLKENANK